MTDVVSQEKVGARHRSQNNGLDDDIARKFRSFSEPAEAEDVAKALGSTLYAEGPPCIEAHIKNEILRSVSGDANAKVRIMKLSIQVESQRTHLYCAIVNIIGIIRAYLAKR